MNLYLLPCGPTFIGAREVFYQLDHIRLLLLLREREKRRVAVRDYTAIVTELFCVRKGSHQVDCGSL
jgi:hypothetical protein